MNAKTVKELFAEARKGDRFWVEGAILEFTADIERLMDQQGITKTELANRLGTSPAYVTKVLRGTANFTMETMVKLSRATGGTLHVHVAHQQAKVHWLDKFDGGKARQIREENQTSNVVTCAGVRDWAAMVSGHVQPAPVEVNEYALAR